MAIENPKISILLPVYNEAQFLAQCIESILRQDFVNWELNCVDDFSTDNSFEILEHYAREDERINCFKNKSKGIIPALELALNQSTGDYVTRMDADDIMAENKLLALLSLLKDKGPGHVATGMVKYFHEESVGSGYQEYESWLNKLALNSSHYSEIYKECVIPSPCWMISRDDLNKLGPFKSFKYPEDYDLVFKFYAQKFKVVSSNEILHYWRDHASRASRNDPNYSDQSFLNLKIPYFLKLDRDKSKTLAIWGAGKKAKSLVKELKKLDVPVSWYTNNTKKIGKEIYGIKLLNCDDIMQAENIQIILAVSQPEEKKQIEELLLHQGRLKNKDYFLFW